MGYRGEQLPGRGSWCLPLCGTDSVVSSSLGSDDDHNVDFMTNIEGVQENL